MSMMPSQHRRRQVLFAVLAVALGLLAALFVTLVVVAAESSSNADQRISELQQQRDTDRKEAEARSARAAEDRAELQTQNRQLRRQLEAVLEFLRVNGLNPPTTSSGSSSSSTGGGTSSEPTDQAPASPGAAPATPSDRAPRTSSTRPPRTSSPTPAPAGEQPAPQPSSPRTPLACVLGICLP